MTKITTFIALSIVATNAHAFDFSNIVNWTGSGSNEAAMLVDWQDGSAHASLVWGYRWNGAATGEQMFQAIVKADPDLTDHITSYSFGDSVDEIAFNGSAYGPTGPGSHDQNGFGVGTSGFWAYYTGDGVTLPTWTESAVGFGDRILANDTWDGWSWSANFNDTAPSNAPMAAPVPAPEPLSIAALGIGLVPLLRKRRY